MFRSAQAEALKIGTVIHLDKFKTECVDRQDNFFILQFDRSPLEVFNSIGHVPLPPYIKRPDEDLDKDRYATVYEDKDLQESVAAPTAGLHFDDELTNQLKRSWRANGNSKSQCWRWYLSTSKGR